MRPAATTPTWPNGKPRSMDNAFAILYEPRRPACAYSPCKKNRPKLSKAQMAASALRTDAERKAARANPRDISTTPNKPIQGATHAAH